MSNIFRDQLFENKVALITGGGSGIGLRIAERFAAQGAKVGLIGRKQERLDEATRGIRSKKGTAIGVAADIRQYPALEGAVKKVHDDLGPIDVVVCGAAGNFPAPALGISANGFKTVIDIDLQGTFNTCRVVFEHLRKPGASVVAISATHAFMPVPLQAHVCAAKAGIDLLIKVLALEWGPAGVRLNCVSPGPVDDTEGMKRLTPTAESKEKLSSTIPLRRYATKDEIADMTLFLCSEAAAYVTGAVMVCDGGQSLAGSGSFSSMMGG